MLRNYSQPETKTTMTTAIMYADGVKSAVIITCRRAFLVNFFHLTCHRLHVSAVKICTCFGGLLRILYVSFSGKNTFPTEVILWCHSGS